MASYPTTPEEPEGPHEDPVQPSVVPGFRSVHHGYALTYGNKEWRTELPYCSLMTASEVPQDWTLQDRIRAYLTLNAFKKPGFRPSSSSEF